MAKKVLHFYFSGSSFLFFSFICFWLVGWFFAQKIEALDTKI